MLYSSVIFEKRSIEMSLKQKAADGISKYNIEKRLKIMVPMILNNKCIRAAVFAFFLAPTLDNIAVTQVPIFCPMIM